MITQPELFPDERRPDPKLEWMMRHHITVSKSQTSFGPRYTATKSGIGAAYVHRTTEADALADLAEMIGIELWAGNNPF